MPSGQELIHALVTLAIGITGTALLIRWLTDDTEG